MFQLQINLNLISKDMIIKFITYKRKETEKIDHVFKL